MPTWHMLSFQDSASPSMEQLTMFHDFTMAILTLITVMVGLNLIFISFYKLTDRFLLQEQTIEIIWTACPVFILLLIALPSLQTLYLLDDPFSPNITVKAVGHQWYWSYEYSDFPGIEFDAYMSPTSDLTSQTRLLETDNSLALPIHSQIRLITTGADVIHSWAVPAFGLKADAVPGRLNQLMFSIKRPGIFYGQCSEICGSNHSFMPIKIEALPMKNFLDWALSFK
uniref:Cytochrome c oxidase subunit 2 n=1 Tax=Gammarus lacustris TaxID=52639 RepID=A0A517LS42_9CRUS|nr:cytochrome c oxidase subunit II [Gammarus lacustris]QDS78452.1 cytochrome c oxidase subunit 2 [Gammarus lacustris]QWC54428.1 cytochrome c oxidase subunit II [Gammarus lacustris]